jgi:hypothetical protein
VEVTSIETKGTAQMTKQDLIDLAIEYGMIRSTSEFNNKSEKAQEKIIETIKKIAEHK